MILFLQKLPIPSLKNYSLFSFSLLLIVIIYANKLLHDFKNNNDNYTLSQINKENESVNELNSSWNLKNNFTQLIEKFGYIYTAYKVVSAEPWCIWVLINFCYCLLILFSKVIQLLIFGKLRALENQHIKDQFWNFVFLKFIFIFGVLNLENIDEVVKWCIWFSIIGFLSIHCQITKDRFEYLSFSASTPFKCHVKLLALLFLIQTTCIYLFFAAFKNHTKIEITLNMSLFMFAEALGLALRTLYVITRYILHIYDIYNLAQLNNKGTIQYYIDFIFEISVITIDFLNYLHMLVYGNFYLSMASLVICMELKRLFFEFKKRMKRHSNYLRVIEKMEKKFPWANQKDLIDTDKCAVCWDHLDKARLLPCSHMFHHNCLRSWLEQDTSCPTCRKSLQDDKEISTNRTINQQNLRGNESENLIQQTQIIQRNLFQFNGSRYISWLPNFSLQITNVGNSIPSLFSRNLELGQLNDMTQQVSQMFPHLPNELIRNDLQSTQSVELTVENILENRLITNQNNLIQNRRNFLNDLIDDIDMSFDDDNDDENEDEASSDDENIYNNNQDVTNTNTNETNRSDLRHRSNRLISRFFEHINNPIQQNNLQHLDESNPFQMSVSNIEVNNNRTNNNISNINTELDSVLKYTSQPLLSENADSLKKKKRDLFLNSKKRYLEKQMVKQTNENLNNTSRLLSEVDNKQNKN